MAIINILNKLDNGDITSKQARLSLLNMAGDIDTFKSNVIEGIGDLIKNLPTDIIADKNKIGEVNIQTRYYEPLLSSMLSDTAKKVILRWPNKTNESAPEIRPDAIISTLIQLRFGRHLGYGEVKPGDSSTTTQSLCVDTLKLAVLTRNTCEQNGHPVIGFQVNGFQLIFYMTQKIHHRLFTMVEIGRIKVPDSLLTIQSFVTLKNLQILLHITQMFWFCCHSKTFSSTSIAHSNSLDITTLFNMISKSSSKHRDCPIEYN